MAATIHVAVRQRPTPEEYTTKRMSDLTRLITAMRPHQWVKNLLLFVPIVMAHRLHDAEGLRRVATGAVAFCLLASAGYIFNDLLDSNFDKQHPTKRTRVFASGLLSPSLGWIAALAWFIGRAFLMWCALYVVLTLLYSIVLKRKVVIDVLVLAGLYMIRILAGGAVANVEVSTWLLGFAMFLFLSLALLKRYVDLGIAASAGATAAFGRGYLVEERGLLRAIGVPSGLLAVLVLALYLTSEQVTRLYRTPRLLWLACPLLLFWIAHMWFLAERGNVHDDPIVAAAKDPSSYVVGVLIALVAFAAV
jgi:4-hydroxybenzoate polyprenyltransferase